MASSPWAEIASWVLLPGLLVLVAAGWSLAIEAVGRFELPDGLLIPVGFSVTMVLALLGHASPLPWWLVVAALVAAPIVTIAIRRPRHQRFTAGWGGVAGLAVYVSYLLPVLLSGHWTWTGYNFLNDTNYQFLLADWVRADVAQPVLGISNAGNAIRSYLNSDYPIGAHAHLAFLTSVLRIPVEVGYQPFIAAAAGCGAMAVRHVLAAVGMKGWTGVLAAVVSLNAALTYQFGLQGSVKEIAFISTLLIGGAVVQYLTGEGARPIQGGVLFGICIAGGLAAYSAAAIPYLGILALFALVGYFGRHSWRERLTWAGVGASIATAVVLAIPSFNSVAGFAHVILGTYAGDSAATANTTNALGQLQAPLKGWQLFGVWLRGEYIRQVKHDAVWMTQTAAIMVGAGGLIGLGWGIFRRHLGLLAIILPAPLSLAILAPSVVPYVDAKLYAIAAPAVLVAASAGLWMLAQRIAVLAIPVAAAILVAVGVSDGYALHDTPLAPTARLENIVDVAKHYRGKGEMLFNEFEEFAKYFGRAANFNVGTDSTAVEFIELRSAREPFIGRTYDLDQEQLKYIERFPYLVLRRKPGSSLPPANYRLDYQNRDYAVWKRYPSPYVADHLPLGDTDHAFGSGNIVAEIPRCGVIRRFAADAPRDTTLVAAKRPEQELMWIRGSFPLFSPGWVADGQYPGEAQLRTPGRAGGRIRVLGGTYDVWIRGSFGRPFIVRVNGKVVGRVEGINTPGGFLLAGTVHLPRSVVYVEVSRPGGSPVPGDGARSRFGGIILAARGRSTFVEVPRSRSGDLCGHAWDWIEAVRR